MIEVFPDQQLDPRELLSLVFYIDDKDDRAHDIISKWIGTEAFKKELAYDGCFDASPDVGGYDFYEITDGMYDLEFMSGIFYEDGDIEAEVGKLTIKNGKIDRFLYDY